MYLSSIHCKTLFSSLKYLFRAKTDVCWAPIRHYNWNNQGFKLLLYSSPFSADLFDPTAIQTLKQHALHQIKGIDSSIGFIQCNPKRTIPFKSPTKPTKRSRGSNQIKQHPSKTHHYPVPHPSSSSYRTIASREGKGKGRGRIVHGSPTSSSSR